MRREGPTSSDLLAGGPPSQGGAVTERSPIGVPADFQAVRDTPAIGPYLPGMSRPSVRTRVAPIYFDGDEMKPGGQTPAQIAEEQRALVDAGLLKKYRRGVWDEPTQRAYRTLLEQANIMGEPDLRKVRARFVATSADDMGEERAPLTVNLSNPADIRKVLKTAARSVLGNGNLDDATIARLTAAYQAEQRRAQAADYGMAETGGTVVAPPSLTTFAEDQARALDPIKADARGAVKVASVIQQMMEGKMPAHQLPAEGG